MALRDRGDRAALLAGKRVLGILRGHTHWRRWHSLGERWRLLPGGTVFRCDPAFRTGPRLLTGGSFNLCALLDATLLCNFLSGSTS